LGTTRVRQPGFWVDDTSAMMLGSRDSLPRQNGHVGSNAKTCAADFFDCGWISRGL
jgi:hypothetical protein